MAALGDPTLEEEEYKQLKKAVKAQVCDVNKALLSVKKMTGAGNRVVFDEDGSYIEHTQSGREMWMKEGNNMYVQGLCVKIGF